jgi:uncharacterized membrane protein (UPF0127 family)
MAYVREKENYLQLKRQELADKEFLFESERSAAVIMRQKYCQLDFIFMQFTSR